MAFDDLDKMVDEELENSFKDAPKPQAPRVVVIDDEKEMRLALESVLGDKYDVVTCAGGDEGIAAVDKRTHAVLLDIKMRGKDGFETFLEIKKRKPELPIIFHSAYQDIKDPYDVMNYYRPFGYIQKGKGDVELLDTLASAVDYYRQIMLNERLIAQLKESNAKLESKVRQRTKRLEGLLNEINHLASVDSLTELANRRVFFEGLEKEINRAKRYKRELTLVMIDIDFFKKINDTYGHPAGDEVLRQLGEIMRENTRPSDLVGRIGGEEFAIIMPETGIEGASNFVERLRERVESEEILTRGEEINTIKVTISAGVCTVNEDNASVEPEKLVIAADEALYEAKRSGRNKWVAYKYEDVRPRTSIPAT